MSAAAEVCLAGLIAGMVQVPVLPGQSVGGGGHAELVAVRVVEDEDAVAEPGQGGVGAGQQGGEPVQETQARHGGGPLPTMAHSWSYSVTSL